MPNNQARRRFSISDADFFGAARIAASEYSNYREGFEALSSVTFHDSFLESFETAIEEANAIIGDTPHKYEVASATHRINQNRKRCLQTVSLFSYYIKAATEKDSTEREQFALHEVKKVYKSNPRTIIFLNDFIAAVSQNTELLTSAGLPLEHIPRLKKEIEELKESRNIQIELKHQRSSAAVKRITRMNRVWDIMRRLSEAVKFAFPDDYVAQGIFALPQPRRKKNNNGDDEAAIS